MCGKFKENDGAIQDGGRDAKGGAFREEALCSREDLAVPLADNTCQKEKRRSFRAA
jgi:hypothetical protein